MIALRNYRPSSFSCLSSFDHHWKTMSFGSYWKSGSVSSPSFVPSFLVSPALSSLFSAASSLPFFSFLPCRLALVPSSLPHLPSSLQFSIPSWQSFLPTFHVRSLVCHQDVYQTEFQAPKLFAAPDRAFR